MSGEGGKRPEPPRLARLLASLGSAREDRALVRADLAERFHRMVATRGVEAARRWYWWQVLRGLLHRVRPTPVRLALPPWNGLALDVRQRARVLTRRPVYSLGVVGTLAIGLASAAVVGSLTWHVWLAPMPFPDPDRVVRLFELEPPDEGAGPTATPTRRRLSPPLLEQLREHEWTTVSAVSGVGRNVSDWDRDGEVSRLTSLAVSSDFFTVLGLRPLEGRLLSDDPDAAEVVLTERLWIRAFGRDPSALGRTMALGGEPHEIVGVVRLPVGYPGSADVVSLLSFDPEQLVEGMRGARYLDVVARVSPDWTAADASAETQRIIEAAGGEHPHHRGWGGEAVVLSDDLLRPYRGVLGLLAVAGAVFLLLAVVNVAGLVAARTVERRSERGVRLALGASEARLLRGGIVESGLLGMVAALVAVVLARWLLGPVRALAPSGIPRVQNVGLTPGLATTIAITALVAGCAVGLLAHLLGSRAGPVDARRGAGTTERLTGRNVMVASQVALTTLLVAVGAGVLRNVATLRAVDLGFEPEDVSSAQVVLTDDRFPTPEARLALWRRLLDAVRVRGARVALATNPPMAGSNMPWGYRADPTVEQAFAQYHVVSPDYFDVMGIDVVEGRAFAPADREGTPPVVIVNDALADAEFPDGAAVGREIEVVADRKTIVGVVAGTRHAGPDAEVPPEIYAPFAQDPWPHAHLLVAGPARALAGLVASAVDDVDPLLPAPPLEPYDRFVTEWYASLRLQLIVVGILAAVGLVLATLGLYALIAYRVGSRRREIGVRMALGASGRLVFSEVLRQGVAVAAAGIMVGLGLAYSAAPMARRWLDDIRLDEPWIAVAVASIVGLTSVLATSIPARRSVAVDPSVTLRAE